MHSPPNSEGARSAIRRTPPQEHWFPSTRTPKRNSPSDLRLQRLAERVHALGPRALYELCRDLSDGGHCSC